MILRKLTNQLCPKIHLRRWQDLQCQRPVRWLITQTQINQLCLMDLTTVIQKVPFIYYVSTKPNLNYLIFFTKTEFFRQNKRLYFSLHFDEIFMLHLEIFSNYIKKSKMLKKIVKMWLMAKSAYVIYEWSQRGQRKRK